MLPLVLLGQPIWDDTFDAPGFNLAGLDAVSFFVPDFEGYVLVGEANSEVGQAIARFDSAGTESWNVSLEVAGAEEYSVILSPDSGDPERFYASYFDVGESAVHVGLFNAEDRTPVYAHAFPTAVGDDQISLNALPDSGATIVQTLADGVEVLALDGAGAVVFHQHYTGTVFADLGLASSATADLASHDSGYVLLVAQVGSPETDPVTFATTYPQVFTIVHLSTSGAVLGATSLRDRSANPISPTFTVLPSGAVVGASSDFSFDPTTFAFSNSVRVFRVGADRALAWSFALENASLLGFYPDPSGTELYLTGLTNLPETEDGETDALLIRLDAASGAILSSAQIDLGPFDSAFLSSLTADAVYTAVTTSDLTDNVSSTVIKLPRDLGSATGVTYAGPHDFAYATYEPATASLVFSAIDDATVRAVSLGADLSIPVSCLELSPTAVTVRSGPAPDPYSPTLTPETVSASPRTTSLAAARFTFEDFAYSTTDGFCGDGGGGGGGGDPEIAVEVDFSEGGWVLRFSTEAGTSYLLKTSTDLINFFTESGAFGDGTVQEIRLNVPATEPFFIRVETLTFPIP